MQPRNWNWRNQGMDIEIGEATFVANNMKLGTGLEISSLQIDARGIKLETDGKPGITASTAQLSILITEVALNNCLQNTPMDGIEDFEIRLLSDRIEICGKQMLVGKLGIPFKVGGKIEVVDGKTFRINVASAVIGGAISLPEFVVNTVSDRVNDGIAANFDICHLPVPVSLIGITVEPGRLKLLAEVIGTALIPDTIPLITA